jgi:hypothetical protein
MSIDSGILTEVTAAVGVLASELLKDVGTDAAKAAWTRIKSLFGWTSDPAPAEIPKKVSDGLAAAPEMAEQLLKLLKSSQVPSVTQLVGQITTHDLSRVVVAQSINTLRM